MSTPDTMQAFRLVAPHETAIQEVPVPQPGPGQVLLKVAGAGLCHSDLHIMHFDSVLACPMTFGHETAGWVEQVGEGVSGISVGEPMVVHGAWGCGHCRPCQSQNEHLCETHPSGSQSGGLGMDGGMAQYLLVPAARHLVPLGDLDPHLAGPLDDAVLTPYHVIRRWRHLLLPDACAVVIGIGGLGHMAVQLLKVMSAAKVIAIDIAQDKLDLAARHGADHTVLSAPDAAPAAAPDAAPAAPDPETIAQVRELTAGRGAELVLDMVGTDSTLALASQLTAPQGHLCCVGVAMGTLAWSFMATAYESTLSATFWGTRSELAEVVALAQAKKIEIETQTFPLDQAAAAYAQLEAGQITGRAIALP